MKRMFIPGGLILLLTALILGACQKELFDLDRLSSQIGLEPRLVAPVVYGELTMDEVKAIFDSVDYVGEFDDGLIYLAYSDTLISVQADTAIDLPEPETAEYYFDSDSDFDVFLPVPIGDTAEINTRERIMLYDLEGDTRLDEVLVKGGLVQLYMEYTFKHAGTMTISSPDIFTPDGRPFSEIIVIDNADGDFQREVDIPSDSLSIMPHVRNDTSVIRVYFDLDLINSGAPISPGDYCEIRIGFQDMSFYHVYGFIDGSDLVDVSDTLEIPIWADNPDFAAIKLADPRVDIYCNSSVGVPFEIDLDSLIAYGLDGEEVQFLIDGGNTLEFNAPAFDRQGESVLTEIHLNRNTCNIDDMINAAPTSLFYSVEGRTGTTGDDTTHFLLDRSKLDLSVDLLLPLDFKSTGYALSDTMEFSFGEDFNDGDMLRQVEIALYTRNELPVELLVQAYFLDANQEVIDSVFVDDVPLLGASVVNDSDGTLVEGTEELNRVTLSAETLDRLGQVEFLHFRARLTTSSNGVPFVKIYSDYALDYKISALADLSINTQLE